MSGRLKPSQYRPQVTANGPFSDSASSHDSLGSSSENGVQPNDGGQEDTVRNPRPQRRRSWGIPSLISRQGSRSNLGIDTGISRAHELIQADGEGVEIGHHGRIRPAGTGAGAVQEKTRSAVRTRDHGRDEVAETPGLESMSSSEGDDMTWEDFLASTDDLGDTSKVPFGAATASTSRRRSSPHPPQRTLPPPPPPAPPHRSLPAVSSRDSSFMRQSGVGGQRPTSVPREGASRGSEGASSYGNGSAVWGASHRLNRNELGVSGGDSGGSDNDSVSGTGAMTWGQFVTERNTTKPPTPGARWPMAMDPPRKASADSDDFDDGEDDDIDDIMSTFGPVSMRPEDDIIFCHKEEDPLLKMDRNREIDKARGTGVDVVSVARVRGKGSNAGVVIGTKDGGRSGGNGRGVSRGFFGSGGGPAGKLAGGVRNGGSSGQSSAPPPPPLPSHKKPISPPCAPPPAYSTLNRHRDASPLVNSGGHGAAHVRASSTGSRKSEDALIQLDGSLGRQRGTSTHPQQQSRSRAARPRAPSVDSIRQVEEERTTRVLMGPDYEDSKVAAGASAATSNQNQNRPGIPFSELRRGDVRRKESSQATANNRGSGQTQRHFHTAPNMRGSGRSLSPPPYPGGEAFVSKSGILRKGEPSRASSGPGVPIAQKLTASALQQLEPSTHSIALPAFKPREGLDGPTNPMGGQGYWGQRSKTRDTLHNLIEGHGSLAMMPPVDDLQDDTPTRERSNTEDSQLRPRRSRTNLVGTSDLSSTDDGSGDRSGVGGNAAASRPVSIMRRDIVGSKESLGVGSTGGTGGSRMSRSGPSMSSSRPTSGNVSAAVAGAAQSEKRLSGPDLPSQMAKGSRRLSSGTEKQHQQRAAASSAKAAQATLRKMEQERKRSGDVSQTQAAHAAQETLKKLDEEKRQKHREQHKISQSPDAIKSLPIRIGDGAGLLDDRNKRIRRLPEPRSRMHARPPAKTSAEVVAPAPVTFTTVGGVQKEPGRGNGADQARKGEKTVSHTWEPKGATEDDREQTAREDKAKADYIAMAKAEIEAKTRQAVDVRTATVAAIRRRQLQHDSEAAETRRRAMAEVHAAESRRRAKKEAERVQEEAERKRADAETTAVTAAATAVTLETGQAENTRSTAPTEETPKTSAETWKIRERAEMERLERERQARVKAAAEKEKAKREKEREAREKESQMQLEKEKDKVREKQQQQQQERSSQESRSISKLSLIFDRPCRPSSLKESGPLLNATIVPPTTELSPASTRSAPAVPTDSNPIPAPVSTVENKTPRDEAEHTSPTKPINDESVPLGQGNKERSSSGNDDDATTATESMDKEQTLELDIPYPSVVSAETDTPALEMPPVPLTQRERDENVLKAHLASWRFCFHEAAALLTPVLGAACVETPLEDNEDSVGAPSGNGSGAFLVAPSDEIDLQSELWGKLVQAEALMLQTMLSVSSGANKDTLAACQAVSETLEVSLPASQNKAELREEIAVKLAGAREVVRARSPKAPSPPPEALEAVSVPPTLAEQSILIELEVLMVRVAMQLMAGQVMRASTTIRKVIKGSYWLLQAMQHDTKAAKKAKDRAAAVSNSGVGLLQSFFFNKKQTPASATPKSPPVPRGSNAASDADAGRAGVGRNSPTFPSRGSRANGNAGVGSGEGSAGGDLSQRSVDEAVPDEFPGWSWEGYLHHADFVVALMHVGTSLMPKNLIKLLGHYLGYTPSFEKGLSLLSACCRTRGMRRPCAAAVLELLVFRELKREVKLSKGGNAPKTTRLRQEGESNTVNGKSGFIRRRIQFRQTGDNSRASGSGGGREASEANARAVALDNAQVALESFYASFPVVPLLSVAHAKALQASGEYEEAHELCLIAQEVVDQSVEKGGGIGPAHDPHVLWLQLAYSSFFLQRWDCALDVFTRIHKSVSEVCDKDQRGLTGLSAAYAAASRCGVQPVEQDGIHKLLVIAIKKQEAAGAKEHPGLRHRLQAHEQRGAPGAELWLFEVLYLHNASAANSMPEAWHQSMLELLHGAPVAAASRAFPQDGVSYTSSETDAIMAHKFTEGLVLYKLERMEEALEKFRYIVESARDKDEPPTQHTVLLTESRFVLPHALYLTAVLSYRLRPMEEQLYISHELCVRAKRIRDYDFDCQVKIGNLMAGLRNYMDTLETEGS